MATRVLMLRHGETSDPDVFHGAESDVGLSELGQRQAAGAALGKPRRLSFALAAYLYKSRSTCMKGPSAPSAARPRIIRMASGPIRWRAGLPERRVTLLREQSPTTRFVPACFRSGNGSQ